MLRDVYRLTLKIFEHAKDFSREDKYTLGQDLKARQHRAGPQAELAPLMDGIGKQITGWRNAGL